MSNFLLSSFAKNEYRVSILEKQLEEERKAHAETKMELRIAKFKNFNADLLVPELKENVIFLSVENHRLNEELEKVQLESTKKSENEREKDQVREEMKENDGNDTELENSSEEVNSEVDSENEEKSEITSDEEDSSEENLNEIDSEVDSEYGYEVINFKDLEENDTAIQDLKKELKQVKNRKREILRSSVAQTREKNQQIIELNNEIEYKRKVCDLKQKFSDLNHDKTSEEIKNLKMVLEYKKEKYLKSRDELKEFKKTFEKRKANDIELENKMKKDKEEIFLHKQMERNREIRKMLDEFKAEKDLSKEITY